MGLAAEEFPLLPAIGLYAADIRGDGNCLFYALSDQLYGAPDGHATIRSAVVEHMREHGEYFRQFVEVHEGGGVRRNPKRKNAGAFSRPTHVANPSPADIDRVFEGHLASMSKSGVYGDNMEITAFTRVYNVDVKIYQTDFAYMVPGPASELPRHCCHIAYHKWQHYSSIRNIDGPHSGPPMVNPRALSPEEEQQRIQKLKPSVPKVMPWQIDLVHSSLPYYLGREQIKRTIEECRGDINRATERLLEVDDRRSPASSAQDSSSVEREPDSDDDVQRAPNKKRDRRQSRPLKATMNGHDELNSKPKKLILKMSNTNDSLESLVLATAKPSPVTKLKKEASINTEDTEEDDDDDWRNEPLKDGDTSSGSEYTDPKPVFQLKLNLSTTNTIDDTKAKLPGPRKKQLSARATKDMKKQAQKAAAKERRQAAAGVKKTVTATATPDSTPASSQQSDLSQTTLSFPTISSGIRTLYI